MNSGLCKCLIAVCFLAQTATVVAHPSSGIVVDEAGDVFFVHSARGVAKVTGEGKLTYVHQSTGGHWLCLDSRGSFSRTQPKHFRRITPDGARPAIIFADGGAPIAVCRDGNLYYGSGHGSGHEHDPGGATVSRESPDGTISAFAPKLKEVLSKARAGVTGLGSGADGQVYVASSAGIYKVGLDGTVTTLAERPEVKDCDPHPSPDGLPGFQGLDVAKDRTVFAAATGCRAVLKISPEGAVETVLKSERPWSPTAVALRDGNLYVLEWTNPNGAPESGWRPRVRKIASDGTVTSVITIEENVNTQR